MLLLLVAAVSRQNAADRRGNWTSAIMLFVYAAAVSFAYISLSAGTGALILPHTTLFGAGAASNKLNVGLIGTWGRGEAHFGALSTQNVL